MGDDWCRMDVVGSRDELIRLINESAQAFQRHRWGSGDDLYPLLENVAETDQERKLVKQQWLTLDDALRKLIAIEYESEDYDENSPIPCCHRMSAIGRNDIFPPEWRVEAYRSFLPEEVPGKLEQWQGYINDVRAGAYRAYLLEWYLYLTIANMHLFSTYLQESAESVRTRDNAWAVRLQATNLLDRIKDFSVTPSEIPVPAWSEWKDNTVQVNHEEDERYIQFWDTISHYLTLQREWNSRVPSKWKRTYEPPTFEVYLRWANYDFCDGLFDWLAQCVRDGKGLYLWA